MKALLIKHKVQKNFKALPYNDIPRISIISTNQFNKYITIYTTFQTPMCLEKKSSPTLNYSEAGLLEQYTCIYAIS